MKSGFCVLWGRPNTGKSTLLNALLGRKHAIVTPRPQTTRHRITGVLHDPGEAWQIVFLDTPGIHQPRHKLGETLVKTARAALKDVECVVLVADASQPPHDDDRAAAALLREVRVPRLLALNKCDLAGEALPREAYAALLPFDATYEISALQGTGLEALKAGIIGVLPEGDPYFPPGMVGDRSPEFHLAELVREQAMLQLYEELPHAVAVTIEQLEPRPRGRLMVAATLVVERSSQKGIVIGQGGSRLKAIGQAAREAMEEMLGRPIYLDLRVKVRDKWRDDPLWISRLGYDEK